MPLLLALLIPALAALASGYLARRWGRSARAWALWTFVLGGVPLILLLVIGLFDLKPFHLPKFGSCPRRCCADMAWSPVADFGHVRGVDLDLGRCRACEAYLMAVSWADSTTHWVISDEEAEHYLSLQGTPDLDDALRHWGD